MSRWNPHALAHIARRAPLLCAVFAGAIGAVTLAAWLAGSPAVARLAPHSAALQPNTAVALVLLALACAAHAVPPQRRLLARAGRLAGLAGVALVAVVGAQWITGAGLGIDQLLAHDPHGGGAPGRIAPITCVVLLLVGAGLEVDRRPAIDGRVVNVLTLAALLVGLLELVGYAGALGTVTREEGALRMSLGGAVAVVLLALSLLSARPSRDGVRLLVSTRAGGVAARRLVPIAVGAPIVLNGVRAEATSAGLVAEHIGEWLFASCVLATFAITVLRLGRRLERGELARDVAEQQLRMTVVQEKDRMARVVAAQTAISGGSGDLLETMELVAANAAAIVGADGAVIELPDGDDLVYRAVVGMAGGRDGLRVPIAGSLAGTALRTGVTQHCLDTETDARVIREFTRRVGTRAMICVPLRHRGEVVAVLKVVACTPGRFDERDEHTLELLAGLAASAVRHAQDERRLAAHHVVAQALARAGSLDAQGGALPDDGAGPEDGLAGAVRGVGEALGWAVGGVWLAGEDPDDLVVPAARWAVANIDRGVLAVLAAPAGGRAEAPLVGAVLRTGAAQWIDDLAAEAGAFAPANGRAALATAAGLQSVVAVPIVLDGRTLGVLELASLRRRTRDAAELELLSTVAAQIAQFVQRRRAEQRIAIHADDLAAVADLSEQLGHTHDHHAVRSTLVASIRRLADADEVLLLELDGAGGLALTAESGGMLPVGLTVPLRPGAAVAVDVFRTGQGRFVADLAAEQSVAREALTRTKLQSAHYEPVVRDGAVVGVLVVAMRRRRTRDAGGLGSLMRLLAAEAAGGLALADALAELEDRARTDVLTGVANRRAWAEELPRELARARRAGATISVALLDLDHFKAYNDTYGHPAGDRLLRSAAAGWASRLRTTDVLARYGGEEFAVILPGCDPAAAARVAEELREAVPGEATCSIGVATWDGEETPDALVARADVALYDAKHGGRDRVVAAV